MNWKEANQEIGRLYGVPVPVYDLKPVLELLAGIDPRSIADTVTQCMMMLADQLLMGERVNDRDTRDMMYNLKKIWFAFSNVKFDVGAFSKLLGEQIQNGEGIFANEPPAMYPIT